MILSTIFVLAATIAAPTQSQADIQAEKFTQTIGELNHEIAVNEAQVEVLQVRGAESDDLDFMEKYFPLSLDQDLAPEIEDSMTGIWIVTALGTCVGGQVWAPLLMLKSQMDSDFVTTSLISWLLHKVPFILSVIPVIGWIIDIVYFLATAFYLEPVAALNIANHHITSSNSRSARPKRQRKAREEDDRGAMLNLPGITPVKMANYSY